MIANQTSDKIRAVFLTALMVTSVFAGSIAFAGTAAANVSSDSLEMGSDSEVVNSDATVTVNGSTTSGNTDDIALKLTDEDGAGDSATVTKSIDDSEFSVDVDLSSLNFSGDDGVLNESTVIVEADQNSSFNTTQSSTEFEVDDTAPTIKSFEATNDSGAAKITIDSSEELSDIEVTVVTNSETTTLDDFENDGDSTTYAATLDQGDGDYRATLNTASDGANDGAAGESDFVLIDEKPEQIISNPSPTSAVSDEDTEMSVDLGSGYSDIAVTISNSEVEYRGTTADSGVYYLSDGELRIDPSGSDVSELPDGDVTVGVSAADGDGNYNYDDWSFIVDTQGPDYDDPTLDGNSPGSKVASESPSFTVDISDNVSSVEPDSVGVTVQHDGESVNYDDSADGVSFTGSELTVDSSGSDVMDFTQGEVTYVVSAADTKGNENAESFSFEVDTVNPTVDSVSVGDTPVNASNYDASRNVTVTFSEPMNDEVTPEVAIEVGDSNVISDGQYVSAKDDAWSDDNTTWEGTATLDDVSADDTANVSVESAEDLAGLEVSDSQPKATFVYDTNEPSASANFSSNTLEDTVDLSEQFDISGEDDVTVTYEYNANASGDFPADDYQTASETFDTTELDEGPIDLRVTVEDDVSNSDTASDTVIVDNVEPEVNSNLDEGQKVYGDLNLSEAFDLTDAESVTYEYNDSDMDNFQELNDGVEAYNATTNVIDTTELADSTNGTLGLHAEIEDAAGSQANATVNVSVNNIDIQDFAFEGVEGESTATVSFTSNAELSDVDIVVSQNDDYFDDVEDVTLAVDDFDESSDANTYNYTATVERPRDGNYAADFNSANATDGQKLVDSSISADANVDAEDPRVTDAHIINADEDSTTVRVEFNEPAGADTLDADSFGIEGDRADVKIVDDSAVVTETGDEGYVEVTFDGHFQTGDSPDLNVSDGDFDEAYPVGDSANSTSADDTTTVHTLELELEEGHNVVSVPAASGTFDLNSLDDATVSAIDTVWTYEDGEWQSYVPDDPTSNFTSLEGGQGYIFVMDSEATVDVNVYNQPGGDTVESSYPQSQDLDKGWNLVGHWQEGDQNRDVALDAIEGSYDSVFGQTANGQLSFNSITGDDSLEPGEGYWVFVTEEGVVYGEHAWGAPITAE